MPFVQFAPAYSHFSKSDPVVDFLAAALGATETPKSKPVACQPRGACQPQQRKQHKRVINPHFDVSELEGEYILEGELPGVSDKSSVSISFDDAQTIVIKGEVQRTSHVAAPEQQQTATEDAALQASAAQPEAGEETVKYTEDKPKRHSVTVEDEVDESETASNASNDYEVVDGPTPSKADKGKSKATEDVEMTEAKPAEKPQEPSKPATPTAKYWISERPIGVFERRFNFQGLIDQDNVKARLENGLLTVVIPKRQPYVRQVQIN